MNEAVKNVEYAVRGELALKAEALRVVSRGSTRMTEPTRKSVVAFFIYLKKLAHINALVFIAGFGSKETSSIQACYWL